MADAGNDEVIRLSTKLNDIFTGGYTALAISLGVDLGLFKTLTEYTTPQTSVQISADTGCKERYIREWLNLLMVSGWVMYDDDTRGYHLSSAQKQVLTSPMTSFIPTLQHASQFYGQLISCFKKDGPNGYTSTQSLFNGRLADVTIRTDSDTYINGLLDAVPEMKTLLEQKSKICEIGCGNGSQLNLLAKRYPSSSFIGCDMSAQIIERAKENSAQSDILNVTYEVQDACQLPRDWSEVFDVVFVRDVIHDLPNASDVLGEIRRIMKSDAIFVLIDVFSHENFADNKDLPRAPLMYGFSLFNCLPQSMNGENPAGLGTMWGAKAARELQEAAGFVVDRYSVYEGLMVFLSRKYDK